MVSYIVFMLFEILSRRKPYEFIGVSVQQSMSLLVLVTRAVSWIFQLRGENSSTRLFLSKSWLLHEKFKEASSVIFLLSSSNNRSFSSFYI